MADNTTIKYATTDDQNGDEIATDDIGGVKYPRSKITLGADGVNDGDVSSANPLPVSLASVPSHAVTNAGTFVTQINGTALTALQSLDTKAPALGQALAAASVPVVLTAAQITTLTPPAAITGFATSAKQDTAQTSLTTLAGAVSGTEMQVDVLTMPTVAVTGTFWQATQPVSVASIPTHAVTQSGTWTVDLGATDNAVLDAIAASLAGTLTVGSHAVTNAGTFATQATLQAGTAYAGKLRLTDGTTDAEVIPLTGYNAQAVAIVDGSGNQLTSFGGGTQYTEGDTDATITGTAILWEDAANTLVVPSASKPFPVEIVAGAGSGGTAAADDADFTAGTTSGTPVMGVYESTPTSVTDGDLGTIGITATRQVRTSAAQEGSWTVQPGNTANTTAWLVTGTGGTFPATQSGTWNITNVSGTISLPTGASTAAKQPALGTAGTASADVITVQGIASMTALKVDGSAVTQPVSGTFWQATQPVSGTVTANAGTGSFTVAQATAASLNATVVGTGTFAVQVSSALPAGTNAIGKLAANSGVDIGDVDVTSQPARVATTDTITAKLATDAIQNGTTALTPKFAVIAASTSGNNTLIAAVTSKKIRVLAYNFIGNGAVNAKFQSGASGTDLTGLKYIAAAGGGICAPFNPVGWFETASNTLLNLNLSGAVAVGGEIVYVEV